METSQMSLSLKASQRTKVLFFIQLTGNIHTWNRKMQGITHTKMFIYLECDEETIDIRLIDRINNQDGNENNMLFLKKKLQLQKSQSESLCKYFEEKQILFKIDSNRPQNKVF